MSPTCLTLTSPSLVILRRLSRSCGELKRAAELGWRDTDDATKRLRKMARACVANFECDIDEAARSFANHLLRTRDALPRHELERRHSGRLLEHMGEVRRT